MDTFASTARLQERVRSMLAAGESLSTIEAELIEPAGMRHDERDALWLYAWALESRYGRRFARTRPRRFERPPGPRSTA